MENSLISYDLYNWSEMEWKIENYLSWRLGVKISRKNSETNLNTFYNDDDMNLIVPIQKLSRFFNFDDALIKTWIVYELLPENGIRSKDVKKQLFDALNETLSLPSDYLKQLKFSFFANYVFLEIIRKSQLFKNGYETADKDLKEFLIKLNRYALEEKNLNIRKFQFILETPKYGIRYFKPWDNLRLSSSSFNLKQDGQNTDIRFTHVIHVTHIETFKKMCVGKKGELLTIEFIGNLNYYFQGFELIWFSVCPLDEYNNINTSPALDSKNSRYGNIGMQIPFKTILDKNPHCFSLGTRKFKVEHEHVILMSDIEVIANLNEMKIYPKLDLDKSEILRKGENGEFIWKNSRLNGPWNNWDNLTFCIARPKILIDVNRKTDIVVYNHINNLCIPKINKGFDCDELDKHKAEDELKEYLKEKFNIEN